MSSAAVIINTLGTYNWNARVYGTLTAASQLAASVKNRTNKLRIAYHLHRLNNTLMEFVQLIHTAMEGKLPANPGAEPVTPRVLRASADNLEQLHRTLEYIVEALRRAGMMNDSITAASLRGIQRNIEQIASVADWFDLASQLPEVTEIFDRAKQEKERGELIDLTQVD